MFSRSIGLALYSEESLRQVFSCGFCEVSKKTFLQTPLVAASGNINSMTDVLQGLNLHLDFPTFLEKLFSTIEETCLKNSFNCCKKCYYRSKSQFSGDIFGLKLVKCKNESRLANYLYI